eukprot:g30767.t1
MADKQEGEMCTVHLPIAAVVAGETDAMVYLKPAVLRALGLRVGSVIAVSVEYPTEGTTSTELPALPPPSHPLSSPLIHLRSHARDGEVWVSGAVWRFLQLQLEQWDRAGQMKSDKAYSPASHKRSKPRLAAAAAAAASGTTFEPSGTSLPSGTTSDTAFVASHWDGAPPLLPRIACLHFSQAGEQSGAGGPAAKVVPQLSQLSLRAKKVVLLPLPVPVALSSSAAPYAQSPSCLTALPWDKGGALGSIGNDMDYIGNSGGPAVSPMLAVMPALLANRVVCLGAILCVDWLNPRATSAFPGAHAFIVLYAQSCAKPSCAGPTCTSCASCGACLGRDQMCAACGATAGPGWMVVRPETQVVITTSVPVMSQLPSRSHWLRQVKRSCRGLDRAAKLLLDGLAIALNFPKLALTVSYPQETPQPVPAQVQLKPLPWTRTDRPTLPPLLPPIHGWLLCGTAGSGKSALVAAVLRQTGRPVFTVSCAHVFRAVDGESEKVLSRVFARALGSSPSIIVLEDVHVLATSGRLVAALCDMLDTLHHWYNPADFRELAATAGAGGTAGRLGCPARPVAVFATTCREKEVPECLQGRGRLEKKVVVRPLSQEGRLACLELFTAGLPLSGDGKHIIPDLAGRTRFLRDVACIPGATGLTGADVQGWARTAALLSLQRSIPGRPAAVTHRTAPTPADFPAVTTPDLAVTRSDFAEALPAIQSAVTLATANFALPLPSFRPAAAASPETSPESPERLLAELGGLDAQADKLRLGLGLVSADLRQRLRSLGAYDASIVKGALIYGPAGTGKTKLALAIARETGRTVLAVQGSSLIASVVGQSAKNVRDLFTAARRAAPSIIILDQMEGLCPRRTD